MFLKLNQAVLLLITLFVSAASYAETSTDLIVSGHNTNYSFSFKDKTISIDSPSVTKQVKIYECNQHSFMPAVFALKFKLSDIEQYNTSEKFNNNERYKFIYVTYNQKKYKIPRDIAPSKFIIEFPKLIHSSYMASEELCG